MHVHTPLQSHRTKDGYNIFFASIAAILVSIWSSQVLADLNLDHSDTDGHTLNSALEAVSIDTHLRDNCNKEATSQNKYSCNRVNLLYIDLNTLEFLTKPPSDVQRQVLDKPDIGLPSGYVIFRGIFMSDWRPYIH